MSDAELTLARVQAAAEALAESDSRWAVEFVVSVTGHVIGKKTWLFAAAEVWRAVDEDYSGKERVRVGTLAVVDGEPVILLAEGVDVAVAHWIARRAKAAKIKVRPPESVQALTAALR